MRVVHFYKYLVLISVFVGIVTIQSNSCQAADTASCSYSLTTVVQEVCISSMAVSVDCKFLVSGDFNGFIRVWNLYTGSLIHSLKGYAEEYCTQQITSVAISEDNTIIATGNAKGIICVWHMQIDMLTGGSVCNLVYKFSVPDSTSSVDSIAISSDNQFVVIRNSEPNKTIMHSWNLKNSRYIGCYTLSPTYYNNTVNTTSCCKWNGKVIISKNNKLVISTCSPGIIGVWNLLSCQFMHLFCEDIANITSVTMSSDGNFIGSIHKDGKARIWNLQSHNLVQTFPNRNLNPFPAISSITISGDCKLLIAGCENGIVCVWNLQTGDLIDIFPKQRSCVASVAISANNERLFSGSHDGMVCEWILQTGELVGVIPKNNDSIMSIIVSPDGMRMVLNFKNNDDQNSYDFAVYEHVLIHRHNTTPQLAGKP